MKKSLNDILEKNLKKLDWIPGAVSGVETRVETIPTPQKKLDKNFRTTSLKRPQEEGEGGKP